MGYRMFQTVEAIMDANGVIRLSEPLQMDGARRVLVTILDDSPSADIEPALLSQQSLAEDWNRAEEDAAWSHLQPPTSS